MTTSAPATLQSDIRTVEEANRMIPLLRKIGSDISQRWDLIDSGRIALESLEATSNLAENPELEIEHAKNRLHDHVEKINEYVLEIEELGCYVTQFSKGIIGIPSLLDGRKIFLCYRAGEDSVEYWHEADESYDQRKEIVTDQDFYWRR